MLYKPMSSAHVTGKKGKKLSEVLRIKMSIDVIKESIKDYAKDIRINLENVLSPEGSPGLSEKQILGSAISVAMSVQNGFLVRQLISASENILSEQDLTGIKTAVSLMGMNNIYYRSIHLAEDDELSKRPAALRMTMMIKHDIDSKDFEIYSLAISAIAGCGVCLKSHTQKLKQEGVLAESIQSVIRIASVIQATHQSLSLENY